MGNHFLCCVEIEIEISNVWYAPWCVFRYESCLTCITMTHCLWPKPDQNQLGTLPIPFLKNEKSWKVREINNSIFVFLSSSVWTRTMIRTTPGPWQNHSWWPLLTCSSVRTSRSEATRRTARWVHLSSVCHTVCLHGNRHQLFRSAPAEFICSFKGCPLADRCCSQQAWLASTDLWKQNGWVQWHSMRWGHVKTKYPIHPVNDAVKGSKL